MSEDSAAGRSAQSAAMLPVPPALPTLPVLRVIAGNPTPEEVAAVTVVLTALSGGGEEAPAAAVQRGGWADRGAGLRQPLRPGTGAWRASSWR